MTGGVAGSDSGAGAAPPAIPVGVGVTGVIAGDAGLVGASAGGGATGTMGIGVGGTAPSDPLSLPQPAAHPAIKAAVPSHPAARPAIPMDRRAHGAGPPSRMVGGAPAGPSIGCDHTRKLIDIIE